VPDGRNLRHSLPHRRSEQSPLHPNMSADAEPTGLPTCLPEANQGAPLTTERWRWDCAMDALATTGPMRLPSLVAQHPPRCWPCEWLNLSGQLPLAGCEGSVPCDQPSREATAQPTPLTTPRLALALLFGGATRGFYVDLQGWRPRLVTPQVLRFCRTIDPLRLRVRVVASHKIADTSAWPETRDHLRPLGAVLATG
jgi:hypothetical protein